MRIKIPTIKHITVKGDFIKLDALLKLAGIVSTGGEAKTLIQNSEAFVDGLPVTARGRKIKDGTLVRVGNRVLKVKTEPLPPEGEQAV
ncbi:MAG: RNA-binding S4 domain-containing protein [Oscillospiraceae bacterium]|jgi:ribosome-associated protein|nr:RNA-binding S4 domain-containing protein [Oscillospiraceae bacterium]